MHSGMLGRNITLLDTLIGWEETDGVHLIYLLPDSLTPGQQLMFYGPSRGAVG